MTSSGQNQTLTVKSPLVISSHYYTILVHRVSYLQVFLKLNVIDVVSCFDLPLRLAQCRTWIGERVARNAVQRGSNILLMINLYVLCFVLYL